MEPKKPGQKDERVMPGEEQQKVKEMPLGEGSA